MVILKTLTNKVEQLLRLVYVNFVTISNESVLIVEYPKSGGTWLGQLVSGYLEIPFPRNKFPILKKSLYHSHYLPKGNLLNNKKIIFLVRDGRDVMVSLYYHQLLWNDKNRLSPKDVYYHRKKVPFNDYENVKENFKEFIDYTFSHRPSKLQHFTYMGNWYEYNKAWLEKLNNSDNIYLIKYEDILKTPLKTLTQMFESFFNAKEIDQDKLQSIIDKFSFENQTKRKKGEEESASFLRKGIEGDWKNYFGEQEKRIFKDYTYNLLVELGYEENNNW